MRYIQRFLRKRGELAFQRKWAKDFAANKDKVLEYWRKYRYLEQIKRICQIGPAVSVLDVGCGISSVLFFLEARKYGIDILADKYKQFFEYPFPVGALNAENVDFLSDFDVVFCTNVLDHTENPQAIIKKIYGITRNYFVLTVEVFDHHQKRDVCHPQCFTRWDIYTMLAPYFTIVFEAESDWIGLYNYVRGRMKIWGKELILILRKR